MKHSLKLILIVLLTITSCKSKKIVSNNKTIEVLSVKKIVNKHYKNTLDKQTISAKLNAKYKDKYTSATVNIKFRFEKDKTIWMSATKLGFPFAKLKITPTRVSYYEKLEGTYFDGDFSLLSKWLGTELDYKKVQNILLGQAVLNLKEAKYESEIVNTSYQLVPKKENELFDILFFLNPENFKLDKQEIRNPEKEQFLTATYPDYQIIEGEIIPKKLNIKVIDEETITNISIDYRSVEFNKKLSFPFTIPSGYKEIELK